MKSPRITRTWFSGLLSCLAWLLAALTIAFAASLAYVVRDPNEIAFGLPPLLRSLLVLPQFCAVLAALTFLGCMIAWKNHYWRISGRVHFTLVALAGLGFTWFLFYWKLLTFGFNGLLWGGWLRGAGVGGRRFNGSGIDSRG
ncbi:MAG TPA: hypothetical protein VK395_12840 [Gemmataceae bacterium]|nr:hypothetical protein [Gemmataceae bacterium]